MLFEAFILIVVLPLFFLTLVLFGAFVIIPCAFIFASWYMRIYERKKQRRLRDGPNLAFFHPYCNAGGGGERVLWVAIKALLCRYPDTNIYIYTVETAEPQTIVDKVQNQFNVKIDATKINFIRLVSKRAIEASMYPYFTLLMQSLGSMVLALEAFMKFNPDIFIDTTGFAFTYPIFRYLAQCPVGTYTHYPTITSCMMRRVQHRIVSYNNSGLIARNPVFTWCKLLYYKLFGWLYGLVGRCADVVMVNGTWTEDHINELWRSPLNTHRVYPPCEVTELKQLRSLVKDTDPIRIVSVAQFRPEKDHPLMLQAMYELRNLLVKNEMLWNKIKLVLIGACRNAEDLERVQNLKDLAKHLSLEDSVQFVVNAPYTQLLQLYQTSSIALHAMWNEHFGISVVECMAAGLVTIAHRSGGPLADIVETSHPSRTGYLAQEPDEYARAVLEVIALAPDERKRIVDAARSVTCCTPDTTETSHPSRTGYLAQEPDEYARAVLEVIALAPDERKRIVDAARSVTCCTPDTTETSHPSRTGYLAQEPDEYARAVLEVIALAPDERKRIVDAARSVTCCTPDTTETSHPSRTGYLAQEPDEYARAVLEVIALAPDERKRIVDAARSVTCCTPDTTETSHPSRTGYLAQEPDEYARAVLEVIALAPDERKRIVDAARSVTCCTPDTTETSHPSRTGYLAQEPDEYARAVLEVIALAPDERKRIVDAARSVTCCTPDTTETSHPSRTGYLAQEPDEYARAVLEVIALAPDERKRIVDAARSVTCCTPDTTETSHPSRTGYLAQEPDEYARAVLEVIALAPDERKRIVDAARSVTCCTPDTTETSHPSRTGYLAQEPDEYARAVLEVIALAPDERKRIVDAARSVTCCTPDTTETSHPSRTGYLAQEPDEYARAVLEVIALAPDERKRIVDAARSVTCCTPDTTETSHPSRTGYLAQEPDEYARAVLEVIALAPDERKRIVDAARSVTCCTPDTTETSHPSRTGYLAQEPDEYARAVLEVIALAPDERKRIVDAARSVTCCTPDTTETSHPSRTGYLAQEPDEYARAVLEVIALAPDERKRIVDAARSVTCCTPDTTETSHPSRTGYLAQEPDEYARAVLEVIALAPDERKRIVDAARSVTCCTPDTTETSHPSRTGYLAQEPDEYARAVLEVIALAPDERKRIVDAARSVTCCTPDTTETSHPSRTGYLAQEPDEYARAVLEVIALAPDERKRIVDAARASVDRFSTMEFEKAFLRAAEPLMKLE